MAGRGSRLRPHTLTVPKPLIPVAGMPIVHRLVRDIAKLLPEPVSEIAYVLGDPAYFGEAVVAALTELSESLGAKTSIYRQDHVGTIDLEAALGKAGKSIERKAIKLAGGSVKTLGKHTASIRLHREVYTDLNFEVTKAAAEN